MLCALNFPPLEELHALQIASLDVTSHSSDLALYHHGAFFKMFWFGLVLGVFGFFLILPLKRLSASINLETQLFSEEHLKFWSF